MANNVNVRLLRQTISAQAADKIADLADNAIRLNFETKKKEFLEAFDNHPVTEELNAASQDSMVQSGFIPKGNLFSLIGFNERTKPALVLRNYLKKNIDIKDKEKKTKVVGDKIIITTPVVMPTLGEIDEAMQKRVPLDWIKGRSWVDLIHRGITGLGQFIAAPFNSPNPSRSGGGIQVTKGREQNSGSVGPIKYVNELLANFKDLISKGGNKGQ